MILDSLQHSLEKLDHYRDELLFVFIKPYWPRKISPNQLTYLRIVIGAVLFILLFSFGIENKILIISLFCAGALTDLFDGSVARGLNQETVLGAKLDPIADRFLVAPVAISSLLYDQIPLLLWLCVLEIFNMFVSIYAHSQHLLVKHNIFWKIKFFLYSVVFIAILIFWPAAPSTFLVSMLWVSTIFGVISIWIRAMQLRSAKN